jgi:guanylate kinase
MSTPTDFLRPLVLSGPSGVGKSTLLQRLFIEFPDKFGFSVSRMNTHNSHFRCCITHFAIDTTRTPRPGEIHGKQYFYVTVQTFKDLIQNEAFIEYAEFSSNFYGTSFEAVRQVEQEGRRCILDIEAQVCYGDHSSHFLPSKPVPRVFAK